MADMSNIDWEFIAKREGAKIKKGYIPKRDGKILERSGVTIGTGVDLGQKDPQEKFFRLLPKDLRAKLRPYANKRKETAEKYLKDNPLVLNDNEINLIDSVEKQIQTERLARRWRKATGTDFSTLPMGLATPLASVSFQYGTAPANIWAAAIKEEIPELRDAFAKQTEYKPRRKLEIDYLNKAVEEGLYPEIDLSQAVPKEKPMLETASAEPVPRSQLASDIVEAAAVPAESGGISDLVSQVGSSLGFDRGSPRSTLAPSGLSEQEDARFNLLLQNLTGK